MYIDKKRAIKHKYRIKENTMFTFFILGGFLGGFLSMKMFRHKIKKKKFYIIGFLSVILHCLLLIFVFKKYN